MLLYPLLGLLIYPRAEENENGLIPRSAFRWVLAGFWFLSALLQLQSYWWQSGQISQGISGLVGQGWINGFLLDPVLKALSGATANIEIPLNIVLIVVCLGLGLALVVVKEERLRPVLIASLVVSVVVWYGAEALGQLFTGAATDFNTGLLLIVMALACWPKASLQRTAHDVKQTESVAQTA